jgi:Ca-activated chloride channel family protein
MSAVIAAFHFIEPRWLYLLFALPLLLWFVSRRSGEERMLSRLVDPTLLPYLLDGQGQARRWPAAAFALAWLLATLALAGPSWDRQPQPLYSNRSAQVVALSLSSHMLAKDVVPERLSRARYKVRDLFAANRDGLNALIAYAGESFVVAPLTSDAHSVDDLLDALAPDTMPVDGDDAAKAIEQGMDLIRHADARNASMVLVTDGAGARAIDAARRAHDAGIRVSVLGVGTATGAPIADGDGGFLKDDNGAVVMAARDDTTLRNLASAGGGRFVPLASDRADIDALKAELGGDTDTRVVAGQQASEWQDRGPWLLLPLLPLLALAFRRGWLMVFALAVLPLAAPQAHADGWRDLWRTHDQQASEALRAGDAKKALSLARDPSLAASAAYKTGDYAKAGSGFAHLPGADAQYNLGNALARQDKFEDAIAAYDRAIKADPNHADAVANRKAVEDWLKKQKDQSGQDKNQQKDQNGQGKSSSGGKDDKPGQDSKDDKKDSSNEGDGKGESQKSDKPGQPKQDGKQGSGSDDPATSAEQKAQAERAEQALKEQMDKALAEQAAKKDQGKAHELGAAASADDPQAKLPADMRQALQRVPDDPGGLLRRKFMLEHQRRQGANVEDQP